MLSNKTDINSESICEPICDEQPESERWDRLEANLREESELQSLTENSSSICSSHRYLQEHVQALKVEHELLITYLFQLTTRIAQIQFRLQQVVDAPPSEKEHLLKSLEEFAFRGVSDPYPNLTGYNVNPLDFNIFNRIGQERYKQFKLLEQIKMQLTELENSTQHLIEKQRVLIDDLKQTINLLESRKSKSDSDSALPIKVQMSVGSNQCMNSIHDASSKAKSSSICNSNDGEISNPMIGVGIMKNPSTVPQKASVTCQFGFGKEKFKRNSLKTYSNHWGDLRARLELAIAKVEELLQNRDDLYNKYQSSNRILNEYSSDTEELAIISYNNPITQTVRNAFAPALRDLMQHGLIKTPDGISLSQFIMFLSNNRNVEKMHAWELILQYVDLTESTKPTKHLLSTIYTIIETHTPYKCSYDAQFKAFVCAALNANKLTKWLNLILQCEHLIINHYQSWSYVIKTGFQDTMQSLDRLKSYKFDLPVNLAVQRFQNITDLFHYHTIID